MMWFFLIYLLTSGVMIAFLAFLLWVVQIAIPVAGIKTAARTAGEWLIRYFGVGVQYQLNRNVTIHVTGASIDNIKESCLIVSNHQCGADILVLYAVLARQLPIIKFFMKSSLIWLMPLIGLVCKLYHYPMISREKNSHKKNTQQVTACCEQMSDFPFAMVCFVEGTRFRPNRSKSYHSVLSPKVSGLSALLSATEGCCQYVIDATIIYHGQQPVGSWDVFKKKVKEITVHLEVIPIENIPKEDKKLLKVWLINQWEKKDKRFAGTVCGAS